MWQALYMFTGIFPNLQATFMLLTWVRSIYGSGASKGTYKVTAVGAKAFSGFSKVKKLSIGANVVSIGSSAFQKCKALKTLTVRSARLTKNGCKKALKGSSIKTVKVPKAFRKTAKKMNTLFTRLKEMGFERVSLSVQKANYAVRMYRKLGFETVSETDEEFIMVCNLR